MPQSELRLIKNYVELRPAIEYRHIPKRTRGIYVLFKEKPQKGGGGLHYDVVYVGMACSGIKSRLGSHLNSKPGLWTHFSAFEVWDNISDEEIAELEGLFRHIYRYDSRANSLNRQVSYKKLAAVRKASSSAGWGQGKPQR